MNVNELMIGDWVYGLYPNGKRYADPFRISEVGIYPTNMTPRIVTYDCYGFQIEDLEPIPLTPEILEKNGWVKTKYAYGRDCMELQGVDKLPEGVDNDLSFARWSIDKDYQYHLLELFMWKGNIMQHDVHYVHQLQHAFRIFGFEKEIIL